MLDSLSCVRNLPLDYTAKQKAEVPGTARCRTGHLLGCARYNGGVDLSVTYRSGSVCVESLWENLVEFYYLRVVRVGYRPEIWLVREKY